MELTLFIITSLPSPAAFLSAVVVVFSALFFIKKRCSPVKTSSHSPVVVKRNIISGSICRSSVKPWILSHVVIPIVLKLVLQSMASWTEDRPIYIQDETKHIAFQVLVKALISLDPGEDMEFLRIHFQNFIAGLMSLPVKLPGTQLNRSLQAKKKMVKLVLKIIADKRIHDVPISPDPKDVADVLLYDKSEKLTDELISDNMIDLMIPGEDSVPLLITLAIKYLSDCPKALHQLKEENLELKRCKKDLGVEICWDDYLALPFTQCVITETLRLGNIIMGVIRKAMKDVEIKGYLIPKGWCVLTHFRSVHLDDNNYESPHQFNPWRW